MVRIPGIGPALLSIVMTAAISLPSARADEARALYEQARGAFHKGSYVEAADLFRAAYEKRPAWKILFNIGQSEAAAARYGLALESFELYLVQGADDVPPERRDEVLKEVGRLRLLVGFLAVQGEDELEIRVDGVARGRTPLSSPIRIAVGDRAVEIHKGDEVVINQSVSIAGGVTSTLSTASEGPVEEPPVSAEPEKAPPVTETPTSPISEDKPSRWKLVTGISFLGVGAAGLAVGSVYAVKGSNDYQTAQDYQGVDREKFDEYNDEKVPQDRVLTIVGFVLGGAFAVAGVTLIILHQRKQKEKKSAVAFRGGPGGLSLLF